MFELYIASIDQSIVWPYLALLGLVVGIIGGLYGVGGFLLTPFLKTFFGIPYPIAVGCSLTIVLINSVLTAFGHFKKKRINLKLALLLTAGAIPGTEIGIRINQFLYISLNHHDKSYLDLTLNFFFICLILFVLVTTLLKERRGKKENGNISFFQKLQIKPYITINSNDNSTILSIWGPFAVSMLIGITTGMLGIGGGILFFPALIYFFNVPSFLVVGTAALERVFATTYGASRYVNDGNFNYLIVLILFLGSFIGVQLGLKMAYYIGEERLRKSFAFILLSGIIVVIYDNLKMFL